MICCHASAQSRTDFTANSPVKLATHLWLVFQLQSKLVPSRVFYRPLSHGGHFESQGNKKLCFCPSSLALDERLDGQNLLFQYCVIKVDGKKRLDQGMRGVMGRGTLSMTFDPDRFPFETIKSDP